MRFEESRLQSHAAPALPEMKVLLGESDYDQINGAISNYQRWIATYFSREHDYFRLVGQDNVRRYLPIKDIRIRVHSRDNRFTLFARAFAAHLLGCHTTISFEAWTADLELLQRATESWAGGIEFIEETDDELVAALQNRQADRLRYGGPNLAPASVRAVAHESNIAVIETPVLAEGCIELLWYLHEQSISQDYHRYGNLGSRSEERRHTIL
jgi:RHH-type transcriptional regulator, proline utilization regulon repressor / proline dehydrogenase / delta 1-pyrroline-5-carboxylate dehydrogenase